MKPTTKPQGEVRPIIAQAETESPCEDLLEKILSRENLIAASTATARKRIGITKTDRRAAQRINGSSETPERPESTA